MMFDDDRHNERSRKRRCHRKQQLSREANQLDTWMSLSLPQQNLL